MSLLLKEIADLVNGDLAGDPKCRITGAGPIDQADEHQITFAEKGAGIKRIPKSKAAAILVPRDVRDETRNLIRVDNPRRAFAKVLTSLYPMPRPEPGIHSSSVIGKDCRLGKEVAVAAGVVIGNHVRLGDRVVLHPQVVVADRVHIGDDTVVYPHVAVLERCRIGKRVIIHAGSVIGSDGFGFVADKGIQHKIPQVGTVQIDDDVEIGANNTIDRATFGKTWIKSGAKTDNQVHIGHNVVIGENCVIVAQVGIAGSTVIGRNVIIAGQAGVGDHLNIGDGAIIGPRGSVAQSVSPGEVVSGMILAMPHTKWLRLQRVLPDLPELYKRVRSIENRLAGLEKRP